jgi:hypothetical protein
MREYYPYHINKILTDNGKEFTDRFINTAGMFYKYSVK